MLDAFSHATTLYNRKKINQHVKIFFKYRAVKSAVVFLTSEGIYDYEVNDLIMKHINFGTFSKF